MRTANFLLAIGLALVPGVGDRAWAQDGALLNDAASECEIAGALGIGKTECPAAVPTRGLHIGGAGAMASPEPEMATAPAQERTAAFQIRFEFGSARLTTESRQLLDKIGSVLTAPTAAAARFRIAGHTDGVGSATRNLKLSEERAEAVRTYLVGHGLDAGRVEAVGKGATELRNRQDPGAAENRRVEITKLGG